jgi:hypothetical protein
VALTTAARKLQLLLIGGLLVGTATQVADIARAGLTVPVLSSVR